MDHMWSPWRMDYIMNQGSSAGCVFCNAAKQTADAQNLVVARGKTAFVILNRYPYTSGHVMAVPYCHAPSIEDLPADVRAEVMELANQMVKVLRAIYHPQGFNLGINMGEAAGAGIADHVHFHVVPRWFGDTNFMSAVGNTRVLPESLEDSYQRICQEWARQAE